MTLNPSFKLILIILLTSILGSCYKQTTSIKYLTDEDLHWMPYRIGDTLFFYQEDSLVGTRFVYDMQQKYVFNKKAGKHENSNSQTKEILFNLSEDKLFLPMSFSLAYQNDSLCIVDHQFCSNCSWMMISEGEKAFVIEGDDVISDVVLLKQNKKYSNSLYYFKYKEGLVQFTNVAGETFSVKNKRKK